MRLLTTLTLLLLSSFSYGQGIWNQVNGNSKFWRLKADSVLIHPRDTSPTNNAFYLGFPVGDSARTAYYHNRFWGRDNSKFRSFAFSDEVLTPQGDTNYLAIFTGNSSIGITDIQYQPSTFPGLNNVKELKIGKHPILTRSAKLMTSDTIILDGNGHHAIGDYSYITQSGSGNGAFASFDIATRLSSDLPWSHFYGVQSRPTLEGSGGITQELFSYLSLPTHNGSGVVDTVVGLKLANPLGAGAISKNFGIFIDNQTRGTDNWSIYSAGGASLFSGPIHYANSGTGAPTFTTRSAGAKLLLWPDLSASSVDYGIGMLSNGVWFSVRQAIAGNIFAFYGGTTRGASIDGTGKLIAGSSSNPTSTLQSGGSFAAKVTTTSGALSLTEANYIVLVPTSTHTITLPSAASSTDRVYKIRNQSGAGLTISSVLIDGVGTTTIPANTVWEIASNGTSWILISRSN